MKFHPFEGIQIHSKIKWKFTLFQEAKRIIILSLSWNEILLQEISSVRFYPSNFIKLTIACSLSKKFFESKYLIWNLIKEKAFLCLLNLKNRPAKQITSKNWYRAKNFLAFTSYSKTAILSASSCIVKNHIATLFQAHLRIYFVRAALTTVS